MFRRRDPGYGVNVVTRVTSMEEIPSDSRFSTLFYKHQYERMYQLEQQTVNITNVAITLFILTLTFGFDKDRSSPYTGFVLLVSIIIINLVAILYIYRSAQAINLHRDRALKTLEHSSPDIYEIQCSVKGPSDIWTKVRGRLSIQIAIHCIIIFVAFVFLLLWRFSKL